MSPDQPTTTFAALADPTRRAILARLASGETSVTRLAEPDSVSPSAKTTPNVSQDVNLFPPA